MTRATKLALSLVLALAALGCGAGSLRRFPLREPVWKDTDTQPVSIPCRPDPKDPGHRICSPEPYESSFAWDGADNLVFRPISKFFAVDPGHEAANVNSMDEVPDSSWFTNRIGKGEMSIVEVERGFCGSEALDASAADGAWLIDQGKANGFNPGFRIRDAKGVKYMLKGDDQVQPEKATGAAAIAARFYYAAGFWAPCDSVVYLRPSILKLKPGLTVTDNTNTTRPFDDAALAKVLANASHRGELVRMMASRWLPGRTIGPFKYEGTRADDPNDVIAHEDRRDLRGARLVAAWLGHFDSREQNSMNTWMSTERDADASPGHVRHWYLDLGDCFGSEWDSEGLTRRINHAYYLDVPYLAEDFVTFGAIERPWDRARRNPEAPLFSFFSAKDFDPDLWRGGYPNPAFARMTEHDAAWAARIIARFTPAHVEAAVGVAQFTNPRHASYLVEQLLGRQRRILERYFENLSPVTDVAVEGSSTLCAVDLARRAGVFEGDKFRYSAAAYEGVRLARGEALAVESGEAGRTCVPLRHFVADEGERDDSAARYLVVDLMNGQSKYPLRAHLYDLGPRRGFRLVGVERPDDSSPPRA
jgi:hypothetical protein